ncbi:zinc-binding dehydrogenase [Paenibacillus dendrobii]|uniref:zinc-binding dehydrogenase n=1 Tax=Paenibacillus dendrobii TaxID=2691084 RepID=UPI001F22E51A|nr:zinc-binding dehydrogenase [Paenibacillus dendrobii]
MDPISKKTAMNKSTSLMPALKALNTIFLISSKADNCLNASAEDVAKEVDLVVDSVGGETETRSVLKKGGILVSLTQDPSQENAQKHGVTAKFNTKFPTRENLQSLTELMAEGVIKAEIDSIFPLSQADKALEKSEARHGRGRILLNANSI